MIVNSSGLSVGQGASTAVGVANSPLAGVGVGGSAITETVVNAQKDAAGGSTKAVNTRNRGGRQTTQNIIIIVNSTGVGVSQGNGTAVGVSNSSASGIGVGSSQITNTNITLPINATGNSTASATQTSKKTESTFILNNQYYTPATTPTKVSGTWTPSEVY